MFYAAAPNLTGGSISTLYGAYIEAMTAASTNYTIYGAGTAPVSLGGPVDLRAMSSPGTAPASTARFAFDSADSKLKLSLTTGAYGIVAGYLEGTGTLDFGSISAQSSADLTISVSGAAVGQPVELGVPTASVTAGVVFSARVSSSGTVTVTANNYSSSSKDPASGSFKVAVRQ
jgi:hypothetical protein